MKSQYSGRIWFNILNTNIPPPHSHVVLLQQELSDLHQQLILHNIRDQLPRLGCDLLDQVLLGDVGASPLDHILGVQLQLLSPPRLYQSVSQMLHQPLFLPCFNHSLLDCSFL